MRPVFSTGLGVLLILNCQCYALEQADAWEEPEELAQVMAAKEITGVDATLEHIKDFVSKRVAGAEPKLKAQHTSLNKYAKFFKPVMDKVPFMFTESHAKSGADMQYDALSGTTYVDGAAALALSTYKKSTKKAQSLVAYGMDTSQFGDFMKASVGMDPFSKLRLLSNIQVAAWVAETETAIRLPKQVAAPPPLDLPTSFAPGLCFVGHIAAPKGGCGNDPVCAIAMPSIKDGKLQLNGCVNKGATSVGIRITNIVLSKSVKMEYAGLKYAFDPKQASTSFGAEAQLQVKLGQEWLNFRGELYLKQNKALTLLGLKFHMSGLYASAFGVKALNLFGLALEAEVGVASGAAPVLNRIVIGGGCCLGNKEACKELAANRLLEQPDSWAEVQGLDTNRQRAVSTEATSSGGSAVSMKGYIGFDAASGDGFFYAALSSTSLGGLIEAVAMQKVALPPWLHEVKILAYDTEACQRNPDGSTCYAYISFASKPQTIGLDPPLKIPMGFNTRGQLDLFGARFKFGLILSKTMFKMEFKAPPLRLADGKVLLQRTKTDSTQGPHMKMSSQFEKKKMNLFMQGYAKVPVLGEAGVTLVINDNQMLFTLTDMALFGGAIQADVSLDVNIKKPQQMAIDADIDFARVSESLVKLCDAASKPIEDLKSEVSRAFNKATRGVDDAEAAVADAKKKCADATAKVSNQKKKCEFLEEQNTIEWSEQEEEPARLVETKAMLFGRRRRRWTPPWDKAKEVKDKAFNKAKEVKDKAARKAKELKDKTERTFRETEDKAARKAKELKDKANEVKDKAAAAAKAKAAAACKGALSTVTDAMNAACKGPLDVADKALDKAEDAVKRVKGIVQGAIKVADDALDALTDFELQRIAFKASGITKSVSLTIKIKLRGQKKVFNFAFDFDGADPAKMAQSLFNAVFDKVQKEAKAKIQKSLSQIV